MIADIILASAPLGLILAGAFVFIWGWALGGAQSRLLYAVVVAAVGTQVALGFGYARQSGIRTPEFLLYQWSPVGDAGFGVSLAFRGDFLSWLFTFPLTLIFLCAIIYLLVRRPHPELLDGIAPGRLFGLILLLEGAALGAFYSADLVLTLFWVEAAGLCLFLLTGPGLRGASSRPSSYHAYGFNIFAGMLIFAPILVMVSRNGGRSTYAEFIPTVLDSALFGCVVLGCLLKAAQFPVQAWTGQFENLPGAAYVALFAGFVYPFAVYFPIRLQSLAGTQVNWLTDARNIFFIAGAFTIFFAGAAALRLTEKNRQLARVALLSAGQFGFIAFALGLGDLTAALQQLIALTLGATLLFFCADQLQIENAPPPNPTNRSNPPPLARPPLFRPLIAGMYLVGAWSFAGLPFSPGYAGRWQTLTTLLEGGFKFWAGVALAGLALTLIALAQGVVIFLNENRRTTDGYKEEGYWALLPALLLTGFFVALGFYPGLADGWLNGAVTRIAPGVTERLSGAATGWLGVFVALGLATGFMFYWWGQRQNLASGTPYNGGLKYGHSRDDEPKYTFARTGRSKTALLVIKPEEEMPEGFDDDFFRGTYKQAQERRQATSARRILPDPRMSAADYFGALTGRTRELGKVFDTGYSGHFLSRLLLLLADRTRRVIEWLVERFYPAVAAFILLIFIILLTR
jgi:formate hydrogenlyase subunit 3/multisubunit Na+/H+ antiporter MnhD subunit